MEGRFYWVVVGNKFFGKETMLDFQKMKIIYRRSLFSL